ncbi:hypothetical protein HPB47_018385 [Ixodes persulcatus]|uniref:Uncharacterized protein n=1 Tax=Ixodes persulcatus TaxID=34615 RepID=A0AC60QKW5_IXOPE|nr:hypothetical protein HPB47_018385 [Ixodes persulcatus]
MQLIALGQVTIWDEILKAHNKEVRKNPAFAGGELPVSAGASDDEHVDEMAKLQGKYKKAKVKVRRLKEELQIVQELNRDLHRALGRKSEQVRASIAPVPLPAPAPPPAVERATQAAAALGPAAAPVAPEAPAAAGSLSNEPTYELLTHFEEGYMMNFTDAGVQLQKKARKDAMDPKIGASVATKNQATSVWGSDVLLTRTLIGVPSNASKDKKPRPPLTPNKVAFLRDAMDDFSFSHEVTTPSLPHHLRMENEEALIATCSHPFFKLRWTVKEDGRASKLEDLLVLAAETCGFVPEPLPGDQPLPALEDSFFEFDVQTPPPRTPQHHLRAEVYRFLEDQRHEMCMLWSSRCFFGSSGVSSVQYEPVSLGSS